MIHLTQAHYRFLFERFDQETFALHEDLDTQLEIIGTGLDATLYVGALWYEDRYGPCFAFYRLELQTFIDGGQPIPNDFDPQQFLDLYRSNR